MLRSLRPVLPYCLRYPAGDQILAVVPTLITVAATRALASARARNSVLSRSPTSCTTPRSSAFIRSRFSLTPDASRGNCLLRFFVVRVCPDFGFPVDLLHLDLLP